MNIETAKRILKDRIALSARNAHAELEIKNAPSQAASAVDVAIGVVIEYLESKGK